MRLLTLPTGWTIALDIVLWAVVHVGVSALATRLPAATFNVTGPLFRPRRWERSGAAYQTLFRVKSWKGALPDAAPWFRGGFPKKRLLSRDTAYLARFAAETARGEAAHWAIILVSPLFFLWNPVWVGWFMM